MSFRNLFKNRKSSKSKSAKNLYASSIGSTTPLLDDKLSLLKPCVTNLIKTDYTQKRSPSTDTPVTPMGDSLCGFDTNYHKPNKPNNSNPTLIGHGYKIIKLIRNTSQGQIFEVCSINNEMERFAIKLVDKKLFSQKVAKKSDGSATEYPTDKNILKDALLLNHCTVSNKAPGRHIVQFVEFFDDEKYYFLVMEYAGDITLQNWVETAFKYIKNNKLDLKHYRKMVKFITWELAVLVYWLHNDMNICHLNITMENIMVKNGEFSLGSDGMISINRRISIKLCDFSMAEIFKSGNYIGKSSKHSFDCNKKEDISQYSVPNMLKMETYNAKKADIWSMGILLYRLTFGVYPTDCMSVKDTGLWAIKADRLQTYIKINGLSSYVTDPLLQLICAMLNYNQTKRFDALQILQSVWINAYWQKYKIRITKKSFSQRLELNTEWQQKMLENFPYYQINQ